MNPEVSTPQVNPEIQPPSQETGGDLPNIEQAGERAYEREQDIPQGVGLSDDANQAVVAAQQSNVVQALPTVQQTDDSSAPSIANDDDLIEKEWVDRAKKIIQETQSDPHRREEEVSKLQIDYLRKRYGKELGASN